MPPPAFVAHVFSKIPGPNVIRHFHGAGAPARRAHQHLTPRQYHQPTRPGVGGAPNARALVPRHQSRPPHEPPDGRSQSPGGQPAPETLGCSCDACPTCGHPSRGTSSPTSQVSTIRGQPQPPNAFPSHHPPTSPALTTITSTHHQTPHQPPASSSPPFAPHLLHLGHASVTARCERSLMTTAEMFALGVTVRL